jgi:hypothetical protein
MSTHSVASKLFGSGWLRTGLLLAGVGAVLVWLFQPPKPDYHAWFDKTVDIDWRTAYLPAGDAVAHLQSGKPYQYDPDFNDVDYDRSFLLPLLTRLHEETGMNWEGLAYPDEPDRLYAVVGLLPEGNAAQIRVRQILNEADDWLGLDYYTPDQVDPEFDQFLKENFPRE